jgi:hypothetical protein
MDERYFVDMDVRPDGTAELWSCPSCNDKPSIDYFGEAMAITSLRCERCGFCVGVQGGEVQDWAAAQRAVLSAWNNYLVPVPYVYELDGVQVLALSPRVSFAWIEFAAQRRMPPLTPNFHGRVLRNGRRQRRCGHINIEARPKEK